MKQLLHLLIVDRDRREGLATVRNSRWLLPMVSCTERMRAGPPAMRWLTDRGLRGHVVGQWLGRVTRPGRSIDWLVVVDARRASTGAAAPDMCWTPLEHLKNSPSLLDYQQWAVANAIRDDLPCAAGPFGSMTWFDDARDWLSIIAGPLNGSPVCYKATPYEVVLGISAARGPLHFKGLTGDRIAEATITSTLAAQMPQSFARTLALERRADGFAWWLTEHCSGTTLAADCTRERATVVAESLARIQQHFSATTDLGIETVDLAASAAWARALLAERADRETVDRCEAAIAAAHRTLSTADFPTSWIPLDLDAGNVLIDGESVRFIDLDDSRVGAVPLALSTFLRRLRQNHAGSGGPPWVDAMRGAYATCWTPHLDLRDRWAHIDISAILVDRHLGWQQLLQKAERGEIYGMVDVAAADTAQWLARALSGGQRL